MLKIVAMVIALFMGTVSVRALDDTANTALLREYARVAIEINKQLEDIEQTLAADKQQKILLSPTKREMFCADVKMLFTNMSRKMRLLEPGVIVASYFFHENAYTATRVQMEMFELLTIKYPFHFALCEKKK